MDRAFVTVNEFAEDRDLDRDTVIRLLKTGVLKGEKWPSGRRFIYRIPRSALLELGPPAATIGDDVSVPAPRRRRKYRPKILVRQD